LGHPRHVRHGRGHLGPADRRGGVLAVDEDALAHVQPDRAGQPGHGLLVLRVDPRPAGGEGHRPVYGTGVEHGQAKSRGHRPGHRRLPRAGGAVDRDHPEPGAAAVGPVVHVTRRARSSAKPGYDVAVARQPSTTVSPAPAWPSTAAVIAMRWSPRLWARPATGRPPSTASESAVVSTRTPKRASSSAMAAMRSVSFTRSSPASRNSVVPSANAAATASTGIS